MNNLFDGITSKNVWRDSFEACDWSDVTCAQLSLVNIDAEFIPKSHALLFGKYLLRASVSGHQQIIISIFVRKFQCDACSDGVWCMDVWINWTMNMCIQCSIYLFFFLILWFILSRILLINLPDCWKIAMKIFWYFIVHCQMKCTYFPDDHWLCKYGK